MFTVAGNQNEKAQGTTIIIHSGDALAPAIGPDGLQILST